MTRLRDLNVPTPRRVEDPDVVARLETFERLRDEARAAHERVLTLERGLAGARESDLEAYAAALKAGEKDPGRKTVERVERELEAARRHAEAAMRAALAARFEFDAAMTARRGDVVAQADKRVVGARDAVRDWLDAGEALISGWLDAESDAAQARAYPERAKPPAARLPGIVDGANGEPYSIPAVLVALRARLDWNAPGGDVAPSSAPAAAAAPAVVPGGLFVPPGADGDE